MRDFLKVALADKPPIPFRVPPGIKLIRVDAKTGMRAGPGDTKVILEAFKPGTAPPDSYSVDRRGVPPSSSGNGAAMSGIAGCRGRRGAHRHGRTVLSADVSAQWHCASATPLNRRLRSNLSCARKSKPSSTRSSSPSGC